MDFEETTICIVGGGPVGTLLSALLSRNYSIPNIVLERDTSIPTDPRAFGLQENGVRCLQAVGLYDKIYNEIGGTSSKVSFISGTHHDVNASPFFVLIGDVGHTGLQTNLLFDQPTMERLLRQIVRESSVGQFRDGSEVVGIEDKGDSVEVIYKDSRTGEMHRIRSKLVIGTDGKGGFTRKRYLEPKGVKMEYDHPYEAIYAGGNLNVTMPTPKSHPNFPLWAKGYTAEEVLELFVPEPFRFMCNPGRQCVLSRFGARKDGIVSWRFEFKTLPGEDPGFIAQPEQVRKILWPYMTHSGSKYGLKGDVAFPEDCLEVRRTWHYKFEARSCTKFHLGRVMVAGDAAHVFPPFGGQGVTTGFLDVMGLSWRLATALDSKNVSKNPTTMFDAWESERKAQIKQALNLTMERGAMFEISNPLKVFWRDWMLWILQRTPVIKDKMHESGKQPPRYHYSDGMPFFPDLQGGVTFSQVYLRTSDGTVMLSDDMVFRLDKRSLLQLVVLAESLGEAERAAEDLGKLKVADEIVQEASYIVQDMRVETADLKANGLDVARVASAKEFNNSPLREGRMPPEGYKPHIWKSQHAGRRYVVVRPDRFVFAACRDLSELSMVLKAVEKVLECGSIQWRVGTGLA